MKKLRTLLACCAIALTVTSVSPAKADDYAFPQGMELHTVQPKAAIETVTFITIAGTILIGLVLGN